MSKKCAGPYRSKVVCAELRKIKDEKAKDDAYIGTMYSVCPKRTYFSYIDTHLSHKLSSYFSLLFKTSLTPSLLSGKTVRALFRPILGVLSV